MRSFGDDNEGADNDPLKWTGQWWLPSTPDKKLPGILVTNGNDGPVLEVMGCFQAPDDHEWRHLDMVHGTTPNAEFVTLQNLEQAGSSNDARGQYRARYRIELAVTGEHFSSPGSVTFQYLRIEYSTLVQWVSLPLVSQKQLMKQGPALTVETSRPIQGKIFQGNGYRIGLYYGPCYESTFNGTFFRIYPGAHIDLRWDSPHPLADALSIVQSFRDFLAFATCMPTNVEKVESQPKRFTQSGHAHQVLLFHRSHAVRLPKQDPLFSLFSLKDVASNIQDVLDAWFRKGQILQPVIDLHLAATYYPQMQAESQFIASVQAVEAFHRRMRDNRDLPEAEHAARMAEILERAPEKHHEWLKGRLSYSNEPGLKKRIKSLFDEYAEVLEHFKLDRDEFTKSVYKTRNYLTHFDQQLENKAAKGVDLHQLVYGLQLLVDICLLDACGIDRKEIPRVAASRHMLLAKPKIASAAGAVENAVVILDAGLNVAVVSEEKAEK